MTHKFRKGDKVAVYIRYFQAHIPAKVLGVERNLVNIDTGFQHLIVPDHYVKMVKAVPRPRRKIFRVSPRLRPEE